MPCASPEAIERRTAAGTAYAALPSHGGAPAPTLLLLAMAGADTLTTEPYGRVGQLLHARGWNVVSLDLPCHGADRRAGEPAELLGWVARLAQSEDIVTPFRRRAGDVVEHLVATGAADPARVAAAGTSRGGFMAFHAAAGNPRIRAVAAFAPATDLLVVREFAGLESSALVRRLALAHAVTALAGRAAWITIGHADERVDTDKAIAFARALEAAGGEGPRAGPVVLRVLPTAGHCSFPEWHDEAAEWLGRVIAP
jgi:dienelactone hydrolase